MLKSPNLITDTIQANEDAPTPDVFSSEAGSVSLTTHEHEGSILYEITPDLLQGEDLDEAALLLKQTFERVKLELETLARHKREDTADIGRFAYMYLNLGDKPGSHSVIMRTLNRLLANRDEDEQPLVNDPPVLRWIYHKAPAGIPAQLAEKALTGGSSADRLIAIRGDNPHDEFKSEVQKMNDVVSDLQIR